MDKIPIKKKISKKQRKKELEEKLLLVLSQINEPNTFYLNNLPTTRWAIKRHNLRSPLLDTQGIYRTFTTQNNAFEFAKQINAPDYPCFDYFMIFAHEIDPKGKRNYIVTNFNTFWEKYSTMQPAQRTFYEIIQENFPCHLYFDLEYSLKYANNVKKSADLILRTFKQFLIFSLKNFYNINCNNENFIELFASSTVKYSCHLIVHLPDNNMFVDNIHVGNFIKKALFYLENNIDFATNLPVQPTSKLFSFIHDNDTIDFNYTLLLDQLQVEVDDNGKKGYFIDCGVYTKNRNFRLYGSSKRIGSPPLYLSNSCKYPFPNSNIYCQYQLNIDVFKATLVCYYGKHFKSEFTSLQYLQCSAPNFHKKIESTSPGRSPASSRALPAHSDVENFPSSLINELQLFVLEIIKSRPGSAGTIRNRLYFAPNIFIFSVAGNKYCENINREHKSNHVNISVDIKLGVYYQKCLDYDCANYVGDKNPLPSHLVELFSFYSPNELDEILLVEVENL